MATKPSPNGPGFLVTTDGGTTEVNRIHFWDGHFQLGGGNDRLGPCAVLSVDVRIGEGVYVYMHDGRILIINWDVVTSVTYTPE